MANRVLGIGGILVGMIGGLAFLGWGFFVATDASPVIASEPGDVYENCLDEAKDVLSSCIHDCAGEYFAQKKAYQTYQDCLEIRDEEQCAEYYAEPASMEQWNTCRTICKQDYATDVAQCEELLPSCEWNPSSSSTIHYLGNLYQGPYSFTKPYAVNNQGMVAGSSKIDSSHYRGFFWNMINGINKLSTLGGGNFAEVYDNNENNVMVGKSSKNSNSSEYYPVVWFSTSTFDTPFQLPGLPGPVNVQSEVLGINNSGFMAGSVKIPGKNSRHVVWDNQGNSTELPTFWNAASGYPEGKATDINDDNVIVGWTKNNSGYKTPVLWYQTTDTPFSSGWNYSVVGTLGGEHAEAVAINNNNMVVGWSELSADDSYGFAWTIGSGHSPLAPVDGKVQSMASDVSDTNLIVGDSSGNAGSIATAWPGAGCDPIDLHSVLPAFSGWQLENATAISPNGRYIVGEGKLTGVDGDVHGWMIDLGE